MAASYAASQWFSYFCFLINYTMAETDVTTRQNIKNNPKIMKAWALYVHHFPYLLFHSHHD